MVTTKYLLSEPVRAPGVFIPVININREKLGVFFCQARISSIRQAACFKAALVSLVVR